MNRNECLFRFSISEKMQLIDRSFARGSIEEILGALDNSGDPWASKLAVNMRKMSPTSMTVTFKYVTRIEYMAGFLSMNIRLLYEVATDTAVIALQIIFKFLFDNLTEPSDRPLFHLST